MVNDNKNNNEINNNINKVRMIIIKIVHNLPFSLNRANKAYLDRVHIRWNIIEDCHNDINK